MSEWCEVTGKYRYQTKGDAQRALKNLSKRKGCTGACYQCPDCHDWHITHYSYRKSKAIRSSIRKKEHGFVQNEYRGYEYDLTMDDGRTEIRYYRSGGEPNSTMSVYKNIDFEDEVCYELPEPYFVAQLLDALDLCGIKID